MALIIAISYFLLLSVGTSLWLRKKVKSGSDFVTGGGTVAWPLVAAGFVLAPLGSGHTLSFGNRPLTWAPPSSGGPSCPADLCPPSRSGSDPGPSAQVQTLPEDGQDFGEIGWMISAVFPAQLIGICIGGAATAAALYALGGAPRSLPLHPDRRRPDHPSYIIAAG